MPDFKAELFALCESMEDEAYNGLEGSAEGTHEMGYWRGQKKTAKSIRRAMGEVFSTPSTTEAAEGATRRRLEEIRAEFPHQVMSYTWLHTALKYALTSCEEFQSQLQAAQGRVSEIVREKATLYDQFEGDFRKLQAENATLRQRVEELEAMLNATE